MPRHKRDIPWIDILGDTFYVHWYDPVDRRTRRKSLGTTDPVVAQDRYAAFLAEGRGILRTGPDAGVTVEDVLERYLAEHDCADKRRQTLSARHLVEFWGNTPIHLIDIPASRRYLAHRRKALWGGEPISPTTVRRELNTLVAAANHAVRWKRLPASAVPQVELPAEDEAREVEFLTKDEVRALVAAASEMADKRLHAFIVIAYTTAARRKSIERLEKAQINLRTMRLSLAKAGERRTKKRRPIVPITPDMAAVMRPLLLASRSTYLFDNPRFDVYRPFNRLCAELGFGDRGHPHILRHSRATHMLQDGASLFQVAKLLGDTAKTVERVYGHHCPDYMAESEAFNRASDLLR